MEIIKSYLRQFVDFTDEDWQYIIDRVEPINLKKKTYLLKVGQVENYVYFLYKGLIRYFIPHGDSEVTFLMSFGNWFASGYDSFLTREPSVYAIETLTDCQLFRIHYDQLQEVYKNTKCGNEIGRKCCELAYMERSRREVSLLKENPENLYRQLLQEQPHFVQQIPLKYLASYIGITPQALSRIRKRIS